jgi:hypothetical protein
LPSHSPLSRLLSQARARELAHLALDKGALALTIVLGGAAALLLAGTDILNWYWLALLAVASLGAGAYRLSKSLSSRYVLAQRIDRRLELADSLSTALYFSENPRPDRAAVCERQRRDAETVAAQVDVKRALPFRRSRYLASAAACAAIAFGLFGVRYLVLGSLDLKASLVRAVYDNFFSTKSTEARNQLPKRARFDPQNGNPNPDVPSLEADRQPEDLLDSQEATDAANADGDNSKTASKEGSQKQGDSSAADKGKQDDSSKGKDSQDQNGKEGSDNKGANPGDAKQNGKPSSGPKNEGMLDKMKNALSDLAEKIKQAAEGSKGDQSPPQSSPGEKNDDAQKGDQSKDQQSQASSDQQSGQQGQDQQPSDAKSDQKASEQARGQDSKSGIGAQDGEKAIKQAEQLQAMGKISEILGKRSAAVSGEVMVEVGSSKQQLKTPWAQQQANHSNAGGEIHRDEIPLAEQPFVERYFEEIRKTAPPAAGKKDG